MKVYLASLFHGHFYKEGINNFVLDSFFYYEPEFEEYIPKTKDFILDSGAFSFLKGQTNPDFSHYTGEYIDFINRNHIDKFMELDIDAIKGINYVEKLRNRIEAKTGRQCTPVWHRSRGMDYFKGLCRDYSYVAIGGLAIKDIKRNEYQKLIPMVNYAHSQGCKIHGLGFTNIPWLSKIHWDSVDSTNWNCGARYATAYRFDPVKGTIITIKRPENKRGLYKKLNKHNIQEWLKFQRYAEFNL